MAEEAAEEALLVVVEEVLPGEEVLLEEAAASVAEGEEDSVGVEGRQSVAFPCHTVLLRRLGIGPLLESCFLEFLRS